MLRKKRWDLAKKTRKTGGFRAWLARLRRSSFLWLGRFLLLCAALIVLAVGVYRFFDPPMTYLTFTEKRRLGEISQTWVPLEDVAPVMQRAVVAAEDANFCLHWGFDMSAIRSAVAGGAERGASTITQQVVKNTYLWPARRWERKALEAVITPVVELIWPKRRILEVYLNLAEFGEGVFGIEAAARKNFKKSASDLSLEEAALLAAVLPNPQARSVKEPTTFLRERAAIIADGAKVLAGDRRAACFED